MRLIIPPFIVGTTLLAIAGPSAAQERERKVRADREAFAGDGDWHYDDLEAAKRTARVLGRPLMVVVRCIPCEACQEFDDDVARRDPIIRQLMDRFACVRLVKANTLDLSTFQYDFDQSMAIVFLHPDGTVLGRYGTRSGRPEEEDISLRGLRATMREVLRLFEDYERIEPALAGKQPEAPRFETPIDYPSLAGRYGPELDYEGEVVRSCVHCHQIRDAERLVYRNSSEPIPDEVLFPNPDPSVLGLEIDPDSLVRVERVEPGSIADRAGVEPGDRILEADGQPLVSTADLQWVLHRTPSGRATVPAAIARDGSRREVAFELPGDWRRRGDLSWRVSTWELRRMLGGMRLSDLLGAERAAMGLGADDMALHVDHVGRFGDHARAMNAGFRKGDVIVAFDGIDDPMTESELLAHVVQRRRPGDRVEATVLRDGRRMTYALTLQ